MAPKTSQLLGLSSPELYAAAFTALGEAGPGQDPYGVFSTILSRKQTGKYGKNIVDIVKAPSQFVANDPYSASQVADPSFGRKVYGSRYDQMLQKFEDPSKLRPVLEKHGGALQFRGQSLLKNKRPEDVMFDPRGNFYFAKDPKAAKSLLEKLGGAPGRPPASATAVQVEKGNQQGQSLLQNILKYIPMVGTMPSLSSVEDMPLPDSQTFLNTYRRFFEDEEFA